MTLMIELPPDLERRLQEEAAKQGLSVSEYAYTLLERQVSPREPRVSRGGDEGDLPFYATATHDEWQQAFDKWVERYGRKVPNLSPQAFSREHMYGERA